MSKEKVKDLKPVVESVADVAVVPTTPVTQEKMQEQDKLALQLAKSRHETALAQAKEALAKNETAELAYRYVVLQLYMKYGLSSIDAINENGDIVRGGAVQQQKQ